MSDHNTTTFDFRRGYNIQKNQCMMNIKNQNSDIDIYIPFKELHKDISKEDVVKWVEIGNKTIFPAILSETYLKPNDFSYDAVTPPLLKKYINLKITAKTNLHTYKQHDAYQVVTGSLVSLVAGENDYRIRTNVTKSKDGPQYSNWSGYASDHQLIETGECLLAYIDRTVNDNVKEKVLKTSDPDCFKITINCKNAISDNHKLAILTFYRFLWSNLYQNIVANTLSLVTKDIDSWDALYYALSTQKYERYYGLLSRPGFKLMDEVISDLKRYDVNNSFSSNSQKIPFTLMDIDNIKLAVDVFKSNKGVMNLANVIKVKCISDKLSSLTLNKSYLAINSAFDSKYTILNSDDYCKRLLLKSNFIVEE